MFALKVAIGHDLYRRYIEYWAGNFETMYRQYCEMVICWQIYRQKWKIDEVTLLFWTHSPVGHSFMMQKKHTACAFVCALYK